MSTNLDPLERAFAESLARALAKTVGDLKHTVWLLGQVSPLACPNCLETLNQFVAAANQACEGVLEAAKSHTRRGRS